MFHPCFISYFIHVPLTLLHTGIIKRTSIKETRKITFIRNEMSQYIKRIINGRSYMAMKKICQKLSPRYPEQISTKLF